MSGESKLDPSRDLAGKGHGSHYVEEEELSQICSLAGKGEVKVSMVVADRELEMEVDTGATICECYTSGYL